MNVDALIETIIAREGGYSDHPADRGGATRYGITERVARANGYHGTMRDFPRDEAIRIYRELYWEKPKLDRVAALAPSLAAELFDTAVNMGPGTAIRFLQRVLAALSSDPIAQDGLIGPATLSALEDFIARRGASGEDVLTRAVDALQAARYIELVERRPANKAFLYGWLRTRCGDAAECEPSVNFQGETPCPSSKPSSARSANCSTRSSPTRRRATAPSSNCCSSRARRKWKR